MVPKKSFSDIFFFYDKNWDGQELFASYLNDYTCKVEASNELVKISLLLDNEESDLRSKVQHEFNLRVVAAKNDVLRSKEGLQDYFDYLFTTIKPSDEALFVQRYSVEQSYLFDKKHNL